MPRQDQTCAALALQETKGNSVKMNAGNLRAGHKKMELELPRGIPFTMLSSEQKRTNSAAGQLCFDEIEVGKAATCQAAPGGGTASTFLLGRAGAGTLMLLEKSLVSTGSFMISKHST